MEAQKSVVVVSEGFYADWEPFPYDFVDLYKLFCDEVLLPVAVRTAERSLCPPSEEPFRSCHDTPES